MQDLLNADGVQVNEKSLKAQRVSLVKVPSEINTLINLTELDLAHNNICEVPPSIGDLENLTMLNFMCNKLTSIPKEIGKLVKLQNLGLKSNQLTSLPPSIGFLTSLQGLLVTDNKITHFPAEIGDMISLRKIQAAENQLVDIPDTVSKLTALELFRMPSNKLERIPLVFCKIPRLCWISLANNPCTSLSTYEDSDLPRVHTKKDEQHKNDDKFVFVHDKCLGAGSSGHVYTAVYKGRDVAVKMFKSEISPDGRCVDEISVTVKLRHPHLSHVIALIIGDDGVCNGMVLELINGKPLADRPNFTSVLRCIYSPDLKFTSREALTIARDLADALKYMHANGIAHGDVYAHNTLFGEHATLCDFGASFFYRDFPAIEKLEVRSFGLMLNDLHVRWKAPDQVQAEFKKLIDRCLDADLSQRPSFSDLEKQLVAIQRDL